MGETAISMHIELDYSFDSEPRFGHGKPPHPILYALLNEGRERYARRLKEFNGFVSDLTEITVDQPTEGSFRPFWSNGFFTGYDAFALHGFLASERPKSYIEIGSGNSTKFALHAIQKRNLATRVISIDPSPRSEIDWACSQVIRKPLEAVDLRIFESLGEDGLLFFDGSHRCFMGSDATIFFIEVLLRLRPGVLIHVHDIFLPEDYWPQWKDRYYSEQYLLAAWLLGGSKGLQIELPVAFIANDGELTAIMDDSWRQLPPNTPRHGGSFWMRRV
jgi:hypothetical protein